ncbi:MAG TPA: hypothetical protein GYA09_03715 [Firmicutes bacterium]|nr:hypothetical protein [Candidatus Fermentithermobacillaceae bacterium]HOB30653.1 transposase [Bacillota bacterium]
MEIAVNGVSTRKVSRITDELCSVRTLQESRSNHRTLSSGDQYPFLLVDAMYLKGREDGNGSYVFSQTENLLSPRLGALLMEQDENGRIF